MFRKHLNRTMQLVAVATLAIGTSGVAFADDGSMSRLTGDSYAYFNNLEFSPGKFNVKRAPQATPQEPVAKVPKQELDQAEHRIMLADRPNGITLRSPFRDNTA